MAQSNNVFQVLPATNQALLAKGKKLLDLPIGQIGVFDFDTNLSIDKDSTGVRKAYMAVGPADLVSNPTSLTKSAGEYIPINYKTSYTTQKYVASKDMKFKVSGYKAKCDTEYGIKLTFSNGQILRSQGNVLPTYNIIVKTPCCAEGKTDYTADLTALLKKAINDDTTNMIRVSTSSDLDFTVTVDSLAVQEFCSVNTLYYALRNTTVVASLTEGFECTGTLATTQDAVFEQGSGYDIRQSEYDAGAYNGRPGVYRASTASGVAFNNFLYLANTNTKYDVFTLSYPADPDWSENQLRTEIAFPTVTGTTVSGTKHLTDLFSAILG